MDLIIASDHRGFDAKFDIIKYFTNYNFTDIGTNNSITKVDYPDYAHLLAGQIANFDFGILLCASGIGMSIAANRHKNIRAALCKNANDAMLSRAHNDANILVMGAAITSKADIFDIISVFANTAFEGERHKARIAKINIRGFLENE